MNDPELTEVDWKGDLNLREATIAARAAARIGWRVISILHTKERNFMVWVQCPTRGGGGFAWEDSIEEVTGGS
jgi:hypothetical protein